MKKLLCLLMICVLFLSGCGKKVQAPVNANFGGTLSLFVYEDDTINPLKTKYKTNAQVFSTCMHKGLLKISSNHEINLELAESYTFSADKTTVTFKIKDASFSDGNKVTGADVVSSLDTIRNNPENMYHVVFDFVESYSASGNTVSIKLKRPDSGVLAYMSFPVVKENASGVFGVGYYKLEQIQSDRVILSAINNLETNYEKIKIMKCTNTDMAENMFISNEVDVISASYSNLAKLQAKTEIKFSEYVSDDFTFVGFNTQNEILGDVNVRRAIECAIDKEDMAQTLEAGNFKVVNSPFKPDTIYKNVYTKQQQKDLNALNEHLEKSELLAGELTFNILVNEESNIKKKVAQYLCESLAKAGISASVDEVDFETYLSRIQSGDYTVFIGQTTVALNQDFGFLCESGKNAFGYTSSEADELLKQFREETNIETKKAVSGKIATHLGENLPFISLFYQVDTLLTDADIGGEFKPMSTNYISDIQLLKIKK